MATNFPCKNCGAPMVYDVNAGQMICDHCGNHCSVEEMDTGQGREAGEYKVYRCSSCGAEIVADEQTSATVCGFCGTPNLVEDRLLGEWKPSLVLPFEIDKSKAQELFRAWVKKGIFTPRALKKRSALEKVSGIYVPFWIYDMDVNIQMRARATNVRSVKTGDWITTYTDHYDIFRNLDMSFNRIPVDASEKMDDDTMDRLEPFRYEEMREFRMPYLAGFCSERYDYDEKEMAARAEDKIRKNAIQEARSTIGGYSHVDVLDSRFWCQMNREEYALLPVWLLTYRYRGKAHTLAMNGQTGKIVGTIPQDKRRLGVWFGGMTAAIFVMYLSQLL
ncbi:TFIIB-type zinc finger domain-containing protein [Hominifimenecus sp. rT4P-3]|uniref:TFIIB-type zinc finger domain-containing protein n=1 Tax=Hominifimenecus sp. rT4P-3 TaxID=3242979 RepID=UPI003DA24826